MKTIKKEFMKLFPEGVELNKNSKIESIYGKRNCSIKNI